MWDYKKSKNYHRKPKNQKKAKKFTIYYRGRVVLFLFLGYNDCHAMAAE